MKRFFVFASAAVLFLNNSAVIQPESDNTADLTGEWTINWTFDWRDSTFTDTLTLVQGAPIAVSSQTGSTVYYTPLTATFRTRKTTIAMSGRLNEKLIKSDDSVLYDKQDQIFLIGWNSTTHYEIAATINSVDNSMDGHILVLEPPITTYHKNLPMTATKN